jgi:hypothetical protein
MGWWLGVGLWRSFILKRLGVKYCFRWGSVALRRKAIWSFRLRLHSGLRQRGRAFGPGFMRPKAEALGYLFIA